MPKITQTTDWKEITARFYLNPFTDKSDWDTFIQGLLDQQKKDLEKDYGEWLVKEKQVAYVKAKKNLLTELLNEAPEDLINTKEESDTEWFYGTGNNYCNNQWRTLLESKLNKYELTQIRMSTTKRI